MIEYELSLNDDKCEPCCMYHTLMYCLNLTIWYCMIHTISYYIVHNILLYNFFYNHIIQCDWTNMQSYNMIWYDAYNIIFVWMINTSCPAVWYDMLFYVSCNVMLSSLYNMIVQIIQSYCTIHRKWTQLLAHVCALFLLNGINKHKCMHSFVFTLICIYYTYDMYNTHMCVHVHVIVVLYCITQ